MKRHHILKIQFIIGVIAAYAILIYAFVYYLNRQNDYAKTTLQYGETFRQKADVLSNFENQLLNINRVKADFITRGSDNTILQLNHYIQKATGHLIEFEQANDLYSGDLPEFRKLRNLLHRVSKLDSIQLALKSKSLDEKAVALAIEEQEIHNTCDLVIAAVFEINKAKIRQETLKLKDAMYVVLPLNIVALLAILYVLYATYMMSDKLRVSTLKEKQIKSELTEANKRFESTNWILDRTNRIYDELIGIDKLSDIAEISLRKIMRSMEQVFYAGAIYIKEDHSETFERIAMMGFEDKQAVSNFKSGQGILGMAVQHHKQKIYDATETQHIKLFSTFIDRINPQIILAPIIHDSEVVGLLELAIKTDIESLDRTSEYLGRATRIIAAAIKSGQNHAVVQKLLLTTQKQTEELSAQQEELRMTNDELVYQTNLLESSEEELRVQQEELSQTNTELNAKAKELESRNQDLKDAQKVVESKIAEVEQASLYKSEFMANMSHELRTPLNSILILAKLLEENKQQNLTEDQRKHASVIYSAGSDLLELINQLLDLAKIESGKVEVLSEAINTEMLIQNLENLFKQTATQKNIQFKVEVNDFPETFVSDEYRLQQVLKNFLSNAFKFTDTSGHISLKLIREQDQLLFSVEDTGKGIPLEKRQLIFEAFRQEDGSTSRKYGGTGLGLSISLEIAAMLNGNIQLESELDKGSIFTLSIPFKTSVDDAATVAPAPTVSLSSSLGLEEIIPDVEKLKTARSILIVEDDINFAYILKDFAEQYAFDVILAHDGPQGIEMAKNHLPDAIILDVMLPIADGWNVLRTLKSDPQTQGIPIHMMSAANIKQKDTLEQGAIGFLSKPVTEQNIKKAFSNIILNIDQEVKKVLLVEDQEVMSEFIKNSFAEQKINIIQAFTKKSALEKLRTEENIDCIILDITLPDSSGLGLLEQIKKDDTFKDIPVIINTAEELTAEQTDRIARYTKSMIHKDGKSTDRLIDEVNLFLNKINNVDYEPIRNSKRLDKAIYTEANSLRGKRVLVVDDDMRNVFALTTALKEHDLHIEIANNGREALDIIQNQEQPFNIVLMDVMMPEMDGYNAIEHIREEPKYARLPIIAVTAKAMHGDHEKLIQLGANDYISKPIDMDKLIALMQVWLS
ncbi:response regulator [Sphingobacterium corticibacter]|uniref:histidine kinase n=1 Tax=Sphingobacterium corticibacter TaxID=2171749 RepID=A0A2T8HLD8_9SPHI|nr:response regulator [Sphingobacterium corticibacter]PVH26142.1 hybrid sensor histidine kinase/response regulator [Sphingobacterium corticibacter]